MRCALADYFNLLEITEKIQKQTFKKKFPTFQVEIQIFERRYVINALAFFSTNN